MDLLVAAAEYLDWVKENPLYRDDVGWYQGQAKHEPVELARVATLERLFLHLGITKSAWVRWKTDRPDLAEVMEAINEAIRDDQLQKGSTGQANAGVMTRLLGLADKREVAGFVVNITGEDGEL